MKKAIKIGRGGSGGLNLPHASEGRLDLQDLNQDLELFAVDGWPHISRAPPTLDVAWLLK